MVDKRVEQNLRTSQMEDDTLNVDFLDWLKKWGPNIIIAVALTIIIFQGSQWWMQRVEDTRSMAWADLANTDNVASLLKVADENKGIGSVAELAWLRVAQLHYQTIVKDEAIKSDALSAITDDSNADDGAKDKADQKDEADKANEPTGLSAEDRADLLDKMKTMYQNVIDTTTDHPEKVVLHIQAVFGMATVAEMNLDYDAATKWYEDAQSLTEAEYPKLAALALARIKDMRDQDVPIKLLTAAEVNKIKAAHTTPALLKRPAPETIVTPENIDTTGTPNDGKDQPAQESPKEDQPKGDQSGNPPADDATKDETPAKDDGGTGK